MEKHQLTKNIWPKITAVCAVFIAGTVGYSAVSNSKNETCKIDAMRTYTLIEIIDTRWTTAGCEYLVKNKYTDSAPSWSPQSTVDIYIDAEREAVE